MRSMAKPTTAVLLGLVAAPVVPAVAFGATGVLVGGHASLLAKFGVAVLVYVSSVPAIVIAALAFALLSRFRTPGPVVCTLAGAAIGSIFASIITSPVLLFLPLWAGSGAGGGLMFWLVRSAFVRARSVPDES